MADPDRVLEAVVAGAGEDKVGPAQLKRTNEPARAHSISERAEARHHVSAGVRRHAAAVRAAARRGGAGGRAGDRNLLQLPEPSTTLVLP